MIIVKRADKCGASGPYRLRCERPKGHKGNHMASPKRRRTAVVEWAS